MNLKETCKDLDREFRYKISSPKLRWIRRIIYIWCNVSIAIFIMLTGLVIIPFMVNIRSDDGLVWIYVWSMFGSIVYFIFRGVLMEVKDEGN